MLSLTPRKGRAMTLVEVLLSLGLLAGALLTLLSVCVTALRTNKKSLNTSLAASIAERELNRAIYAAQCDAPPGARAAFWDGEFAYPATAYSTGQAKAGEMEISYAIYAHTLAASSQRIKKVDIVAWWWGHEQRGREGSGRMEMTASRVVNEEK